MRAGPGLVAATVRRHPRARDGACAAPGRRDDRPVRSPCSREAGDRLSAPRDSRISALRGRPSSRTNGPAIAWSPATSNSTSWSVPGIHLDLWSDNRGSRSTSPRHPASLSSVVHKSSADTTTTKKTTVKIVSASLGGKNERGEDDRRGAAQTCPPEQRALRVREGHERRRHSTATARTGSRPSAARASAAPPAPPPTRSLGNTSKPKTTNIVTWAEEGEPLWKATNWRR